MTLLLVLDDAHLGNTLFMKAFGHSLSALKGTRLAILHASERYTDSLIQTGMFRTDASVRAAREINRKLVTWLADHGISCASMHGDQRGLFHATHSGLHVDRTKLETFASQSVWLISTLVSNENGSAGTVPLATMARFLETHLPADHVVVFSMAESDDILNPDGNTHLDWSQRVDFIHRIPDEFKDYIHPLVLSGTGSLGLIPDGKRIVTIR
jgi:acetylglutamate kinase